MRLYLNIQKLIPLQVRPPHLLVLYLLRSELVQQPTVSYGWEVLPQGALTHGGHEARLSA